MNGTDVVMGCNQIAALCNLPWGQLKKVSKFKHYDFLWWYRKRMECLFWQ